jgi:hypothetical protein
MGSPQSSYTTWGDDALERTPETGSRFSPRLESERTAETVRRSNAVWIRAAVPDFNLLDGTAMGQLFRRSFLNVTFVW